MAFGRKTLGDGPNCPDADPQTGVRTEHGAMFRLPGGLIYCPDQDHDRTGRPNKFEQDGVTPRSRREASR